MLSLYEAYKKKYPIRMRWEEFKLSISEMYWRLRNRLTGYKAVGNLPASYAKHYREKVRPSD
jgi:hypothetical protein